MIWRSPPSHSRFVDGDGDGHASGFLGQHSPLACFCSLIDSDIFPKGFLPLCVYGIAIRENNDDLNNRRCVRRSIVAMLHRHGC